MYHRTVLTVHTLLLFIRSPFCDDRAWLLITTLGHPSHVNGLFILQLTSFLTRRKMPRCCSWMFIWTPDSEHWTLGSSLLLLMLVIRRPLLHVAADFHTSVQNDHCSPAGGRPPTGSCNNFSSVLSPAVPKCFPADSYKVLRPWEESKLPFSSHCWNIRKSEKAFHYPQQVSAPGYINTSN